MFSAANGLARFTVVVQTLNKSNRTRVVYFNMTDKEVLLLAASIEAGADKALSNLRLALAEAKAGIRRVTTPEQVVDLHLNTLPGKLDVPLKSWYYPS